MKYIKQKLELSIYGYQPGVFLPIRRDGELINKTEFLLYKLNRLIDKFSNR